MLKPIDFIPSIEIEEVVFISLETIDTNLANVCNSSSYSKDCDNKWRTFCKQHNLSKREQCDKRWFNLYLDLCAEGLL